MPRIRNFPLHADWDNISETEISSVIWFVEQFISDIVQPQSG